MIFKEVQDKGRTLTCNAWRWYSKRRCSAAVRRRERKCDFRIEPGHPIRQRGNPSDSVDKNLFNPNFRMPSSDIREKEKVAKQDIVLCGRCLIVVMPVISPPPLLMEIAFTICPDGSSREKRWLYISFSSQSKSGSGLGIKMAI